MSEFWPAFFPNFLSTSLGIVFGLPVALFVNYSLIKSQRRHDLIVEAKNRRYVGGVLIKSLSYNALVLNDMLLRCKNIEVKRNADLQLTTWDAVGTIFSTVCDDAELLQVTSHHWLRLQRLDLFNSEMFIKSLDGDSKGGNGSAIWLEFHNQLSDLHAHALEIRERLERFAEK